MDRTTHGSGMVRAIETAFDAVRTRHPELQGVVIVVASGTAMKLSVNGHFASMRWHGADDAWDEILIAGERVQDGGEAVFETLLHEAAHALGARRGLATTSRGGRYHNARFAECAEEVGLECFQGTHGFAETAMPPETAKRYAKVIAQLSADLALYRQPEGTGEKKPRQQAGRAECQCGRVIRASARVLEEAPIICGACNSVFAVEVDAEGQIVTARTTGPVEIVPWLLDNRREP